MSRKAIFIVIGAALALRLAILSISFEAPPFADGYNYINIVENMRAGHGMRADVLGGWRALFPPIYPLALFFFSLTFGLSVWSITALNFAFDLAAAAGIIYVARLLNSERSGWWGAATYLLWPTSIILAPLATKEPMVTCLVVWMFALLIERRAVEFGALSGILALSQPGLAFMPAVALLVAGDRLKMIREAVPVAVIVMAPWWLRNFQVLHAFVPLTTGAGMGLWMAAIPWGNGLYQPFDISLIGPNEIATNRAAAAAAWGYISADPLGYFAHTLRRLLNAFSGDEWAMRSLTLRNPPLFLLASPAVALPPLLYAGSAVGAMFERNAILMRLLVACLANVFLFQMWFEFSQRHRYHLTPLLLLIAAMGLHAAIEAHHRPRDEVA